MRRLCTALGVIGTLASASDPVLFTGSPACEHA